MNNLELSGWVEQHGIQDWYSKFPEATAIIHKADVSKEDKLSLMEHGLDTLPSVVEKMTYLRTVNLFGNRFREFPPQLLALKSVEVLQLSGNCISSLPPELSKFTRLRVFHMSRNAFAPGDLPSVIYDLNSLSVFSFNGNRLQRISDAISKLENLKEIHLADNQLVSISSKIGQLSTLTTLNVCSNKELKAFPDTLEDCCMLSMILCDGTLISVKDKHNILKRARAQKRCNAASNLDETLV